MVKKIIKLIFLSLIIFVVAASYRLFVNGTGRSLFPVTSADVPGAGGGSAGGESAGGESAGEGDTGGGQEGIGCGVEATSGCTSGPGCEAGEGGGGS